MSIQQSVKKTQKFSLLRPQKQRQIVVQPKMSARDKREVIGVILMIAGVVLIIVGLALSYIEWTTLPAEKLALMVIVESMEIGIGMIVAGFILFGIGLGVYLAESNRQAWNRARRLLPV